MNPLVREDDHNSADDNDDDDDDEQLSGDDDDDEDEQLLGDDVLLDDAGVETAPTLFRAATRERVRRLCAPTTSSLTLLYDTQALVLLARSLARLLPCRR